MGNFVSGTPLISYIANKFPSMDYEGQRLAEKCYQWIIVLFGVVGFIWGYFCQQYIQTVYVLGAGVLLATLLVIPPWPMFRRHPLQWQNSRKGRQGRQDKAKTS
ncbi:Signal peptidase complex subunit 1 [Geodia barretti]|uniref:Signal peptidase complex subunit 1 n=1 Tax=Geodia barretti TaxID=519541 RepID=A0AA35W9F5_GEOBA|nr:Signal peptidase complex subunit 1 [Geodia barretti]